MKRKEKTKFYTMTVISQYNKYFREEDEFISNKVRNTFFQSTYMYP